MRVLLSLLAAATWLLGTHGAEQARDSQRQKCFESVQQVSQKSHGETVFEKEKPSCSSEDISTSRFVLCVQRGLRHFLFFAAQEAKGFKICVFSFLVLRRCCTGKRWRSNIITKEQSKLPLVPSGN